MKLLRWIDHRTGLVAGLRSLVDLDDARNPRWRDVWARLVVFSFVLQLVTGILMMTAYTPSATTAWSSVWYLHTHMTAGWLIRGLHHFGSQAFVVLVVIHALVMLIDRAYRTPRELAWWLTLSLIALIPVACVTGWLLPYDQKGYWATKVPTNILGLVPFVGGQLRQLALGGPDYGHATISRFFTIHVMIVPAIIAGILFLRRLTLKRANRLDPQVNAEDPVGAVLSGWVRSGVAIQVFLGGLIALAAWEHLVKGEILLGTPADPSNPDYPARPEWYFLFLFQFLKFFDGQTGELIGAILIPGALMTFFAAAPWIDRLPLGRNALLGGAGLLALGAVSLTWLAYQEDQPPNKTDLDRILAREGSGEPLSDADLTLLRARDFQEQKRLVHHEAEIFLDIVGQEGVPPDGPLAMIRREPMIQGPKLFAANCASCHRFDGHDGMGRRLTDAATSSDLKDFGTTAWVRGFLAAPMDEAYFGLMFQEDGDPAHTKMQRWVEDQTDEHGDDPELKAAHEARLDAVSAWLASEAIDPGGLAWLTNGDEDVPEGAAAPTQQLRDGRLYFVEECNSCHSYGGERSGTTRAPELKGYGSPSWIEGIIRNAGHDDYYRSSGREPAQMPAFEDRLTDAQIRILAEWLHRVSHPAD